MKKSVFFLILAATLFVASVASAQTTWSLRQCISYAWENNLTIKQGELNRRNAELTLRQNQLSRLPTFNGTSNLGFQFGRTIDPTTNTFSTERTGFNTFSINAGVTLFSGNAINNRIAQGKTDLEAAQLDVQASANDIGLLVANTYLTVLLAEEQGANAQRTLELTRSQLDQVDKLIRAGARPANERLDLEATLARNEQALIEINNQITNTYLTLKQLLQLDPGIDLRVEQPQVNLPTEALQASYDLEQVYAAALLSQPQVAAAELRVRSAGYSESLARAAALPSLTIFAGLSSNYSSVARDFLNPNTDNVVSVPNPPQEILVNGQPVTITTFRQEGLTFPNVGYFDQITENFGQSLGLSLSVPIYNQHRNRIAVQRAQISSLGAGIQRQQVRDQLKTNIQQAITNVLAARESYRAAERTQAAAQAAFDNASRRFELGAINTFEYASATTNLDQARTDLSRTKFQLLFNYKVMEFYLGRPLEL